MDLKIHHPKVNIELDPQKMEDAFSMLLSTQLYRGLFRYGPSGDVEKDLAEKWSESPDRKTYKIKLKYATFSNGQKITAKNVQMTFARIFMLGSAIGADIDYIKGSQEFSKTKDISVFGVIPISEDEVEFKLAQPSALFLKHLAVVDCSILPINDFKEALNTTPSGAFSGPYKLTEASPGVHKFEKWRSDSFDSARPPKRITYFESEENLVELAKKGQTDTLDRDPVTKEDTKILYDKAWNQVPTELTGETFIILNPKYIPLEVRQYLFQKANVETLTKSLGDAQFVPSYGLIPIGFTGTMTAQDVAILKNSNAQYSGKKVSFDFDFDPTYADEKRVAEFLKNSWEKFQFVVDGIKRRRLRDVTRLIS